MRSSVVAFLFYGAAAAVAPKPPAPQCKTFPGDAAWPSQAEWSNFNKTVGGRLVATVPLGAPCHGATFNSAVCEDLKTQWQAEKIQ